METMTTDNATSDPRINALAKFLECEPDELTQSKYDECSIEHGNREYLVCTDSEADEKVNGYCLDTLWAFRAEFLVDYIDNDDRDALVKSIKTIQEQLCESCNATIKAMLGNNIGSMIDDAISADGRGHFLSSYDGEENEVDGFFIYRTN